MKFTSLNIPEVVVIEPELFEDERGFFFEIYNQEKFKKLIGEDIAFVQDNYSKSKHGVLRGLHYQEAPFTQAKLVHVLRGEIYDVAVDIRKDSPYFGKHVFIYLSCKNKKLLWIPEGFAHGFQALSDASEVIYKVNNYYSKEHERIIDPLDINLKIDWPFKKNLCLSEKDKYAKLFSNNNNL